MRVATSGHRAAARRIRAIHKGEAIHGKHSHISIHAGDDEKTITRRARVYGPGPA